MATHHKASICRIEIKCDREKIILLKEKGRQIYLIQKELKLLLTGKPEDKKVVVEEILNKSNGRPVLIKSEKRYGAILRHGAKNRPHIANASMNPPAPNTTKWELVIMPDGKLFAITEDHFKGEEIKNE